MSKETSSVKLPLTRGLFAIVDACDFAELSKFKWSAVQRRHTFYAIRNHKANGKRTMVYLHRHIVSPATGVEIDHANHDGLDNRRENLRIATRSQNLSNRRKKEGTTSRYKGVSRARYGWQVHIHFEGMRKHLGLYKSEEQAYAAYCEAAKSLHGEFACLEVA